MKKHAVVILIAVVLVLAVAWSAFGQAGGGQGFQQFREARLKAIADIQEQVGKLKALFEQAPSGRSSQDASEEERTKRREAREKRDQEQRAILGAIQQDVDRLKGPMALMAEQNESLKPLQELLASAKQENAKETAGKIEKLIAERKKQFEDKMAAMGVTAEQLERMSQFGQRQRQQ